LQCSAPQRSIEMRRDPRALGCQYEKGFQP
jgi:hypothetical protein